MFDGIGDSIGELLIKLKPDATNFGADLEKAIGPATQRALNGVQSASRAALGAITAIGTGLYSLGVQLDDAYDNIRIGTGATGDALIELQGVFDDVAQKVPNDLGEVSQAVADLNTRLGLTGPELDALSEQFLQLTNITGEELGGAIESVTALFNQFNISVADQGPLLDNLFQASQASGESVTELANALVKSGATLEAFGLTVEEGADLIALLAKNGVAAREVQLALTKVLQDAAAAGVPAADAFAFLEAQIKGAATEAEATAIALEAFGPKAGAKLAQQIRDGTLSLTDFQDALGATDDSIVDVAEETADAAETFKKLKNQLAITLGPAANKLFASFGESATNAAPAILAVVNALTPLLLAFSSLPTPVLATIIGLLTVGATLTKLTGIINGVTATFRVLSGVLAANPYIVLTAATVALVLLLATHWEEVKAIVGNAMQFLSDLFNAYLPLFQGAWDSTFGAISGAVSSVGDAFGRVGEVIGGVWNTIVGATTTAVDTLIGLLQDLAAAADKALGPLDEIVGGVGGAIGSFFGGFRADGGPVRAGMSYIVGERGPEVFTADRNGYIVPNSAAAPAGQSVTIQGPLVAIQGPVQVRSDDDITTLSRRLSRDAAREMRAFGIQEVTA